MSTLRRAWSIDNLRRAWGWVRSNPDRAYKSYFRELYSAYAIADEALLAHLADRLRRGIYQPTDACKIFLPKASGILRPVSLLAVEDQIVYQALANIVAERLFPHVAKRYNHQVFGHLYAGVASPWFYRKWSDGYRAFNKAAEAAFARGYKWTASFDLTAFYESIDHQVLRHFLERIGCDSELAKKLNEYLSKWTATSRRIYQGHGIPQGPLSSGLIAESVLTHFDENHRAESGVKYFRYVDDIRLFARDDRRLRGMLVALDRLSKDVGLFPQSSKIDIHEIADIQEELKTVSAPLEEVLAEPEIDQKALRRRLVELSPQFQVKNSTRFKYLLARATPSAGTTDRLWRIYEKQPHLYDAVSRYLARSRKFTDKVGNRLVEAVERQEIYPGVRAAFINVSIGKLSGGALTRAKRRFKPLWTPRSSPADLSDALAAWLHYERRFTDRQAEYSVVSTKPGWLRARIQYSVPWSDLPESHRRAWLNANLRSDSADVAVSAARLMSVLAVTVLRPVRDVHPLARLVLKEFGALRRAKAGVCGIRLAIEEMTGCDIAVAWRAFFGRNYKYAEAQIVECKGYFKTSANSWVNGTDVFIDWLLDALFRRDPALGTYTMGNVGGYLSHGALRANYPAVFRLLNEIHTKRYESNLSHALVRRSGQPTRRIQFTWLRKGAGLIRRAAEELAIRYPAG
jgi:hypothetical protein